MDMEDLMNEGHSHIACLLSLQGTVAGCALLTFALMSAHAQQITGTPGSPNATTTLDGK
jgi:hypothetical protein